MTERVNSLVVVLEKDMRDDDVDCLINAIAMMRNVMSVNMVKTQSSDYDVTQRERNRSTAILMEAQRKILEGD